MSTTHQSTSEPQPLRIDDFDWSHVDIARRAMMSLLEQIKTYEGQYDALPLPDSQASREMMLIPQVEKAYHRVGTLMMNAFDHAYALNALPSNPKPCVCPLDMPDESFSKHVRWHLGC